MFIKDDSGPFIHLREFCFSDDLVLGIEGLKDGAPVVIFERIGVDA